MRFFRPSFCFSVLLVTRILSAQSIDLLSHVDKRVEPLYPPIAKAAQVSGVVEVNVTVDQRGIVTRVVPVSGPAMLRSAAVDAVRKWTFYPIIGASGKPAPATGTLALNFALPDPTGKAGQAAIDAARRDDAIQRRYFPVSEKCRNLMRNAETRREASSVCVEAADLAATFDPGTRFIEKRAAYNDASRSLVDAGQATSALPYADKAVATVEAGHDDHSGTNSVYATRGLVLAVLGRYDDAIRDFSKAESEEKQALAWAATIGEDSAFLTREYRSAMMWTLLFHAKTLSAMGRKSDADATMVEAAKYNDSPPLPVVL